MDGNGHNPQTPGTSTITLTFDIVTRQVQLNATTQDEMVLLYMLEKAKDAVKDFIKKQAENSRIVPASAMPPIIQH